MSNMIRPSCKKQIPNPLISYDGSGSRCYSFLGSKQGANPSATFPLYPAPFLL